MIEEEPWWDDEPEAEPVDDASAWRAWAVVFCLAGAAWIAFGVFVARGLK